MFLVDDVLLFPIRSLVSLFLEIRNTAQQEAAKEAESTRIELGELNMMFETGRISTINGGSSVVPGTTE